MSEMVGPREEEGYKIRILLPGRRVGLMTDIQKTSTAEAENRKTFQEAGILAANWVMYC